MAQAQQEVPNIPSEAQTQDGEIISSENLTEKDEELLKTFEYTQLDLMTQEMRFLTLEPGIPKSPIDCSLSAQLLPKCEPYTYVINTRGNPISWIGIAINNQVKHVTRNIAVFLNHIRSESSPQRLWFRDVCLNHLDPEEKSRYWNQEWMDNMIQHASKVIDLSETMASLWDLGKLPRPFPPEEKEWNETREMKQPKHRPAPLHMQKGLIDPPPPHEYLPLDYVADEFRLITLWPAENYDDPLRASLAYSVMHDNITYHALSYTWGPATEQPTSSILLNGQRFTIRKNLELALRELRPQRCTIWIDAICINQTNISERNRQIPRMLEIYDAADSVIGWLGPSDTASDTAIDFLSELKSPKLHPDEHGNWGPYTAKENDKWKIKPIDDLPRRLAALYRLFLRPYFRRIWVIQELAAANSPTVYCGKKRVAWRNLDMAAYHLTDILHRDPSMPAKMQAADPSLTSVETRNITFVRRLFYLRHLRSKNADHWAGTVTSWTKHKPNSPGILDLMILGRDFSSTSPHDKIFALLNLAQDIKGLSFNPEYSRSLTQTYQDFTIAVANKTGSLDIIAAAEPFTSAGLNVPSWCPDWDTPSSVSSLVRREHIPNLFMTAVDDISGPVYSACGPPTTSPRFSFNDNGVLEVAGLILDTVKSVHHEHGSESITTWLSIAASALLPPDNHEFSEAEMAALMSKFFSMLNGDVTGVWNIETISDDDHETQFRPICVKPEDCRHRTRPNLADDMISILARGRSLVVTENGYMGLAPHYAEKGQKIAVLSNCSVPILMKEIDHEEGTYRMLGGCFVQEWMEGEILAEMGFDDDWEEAWEVIDGSGRLSIV